MSDLDRRQNRAATLSAPRTDRSRALDEMQVSGQQLLNRGSLDLEEGTFSLRLNQKRADKSSNEYQYTITFNRDGSLEMGVSGVYSGVSLLNPFKYGESKSFSPDKRDGTRAMASEAVRYLAGLMQKNTPWVTETQVKALCDEVFLRLAPANAQRTLRDEGERFVLDKDADRDKMNRKAAAMATTVAQQFNKQYGELGCYSLVRSMSLVFLKDSPLFGGAFVNSKTLEVKEIFAKLRGKTPVGGLEIRNGEYSGTFHFFTPHIRELDDGTKHMMENLQPGTIVFMQQDGRADPSLRAQRQVSHIGIVVQGKQEGGMLGLGAKNPVVMHVIGDKLLFDQIQEQDCEKNRWMGVGRGWSIAGVLRPNSKSVQLPQGIDSLKGEVADITFARYREGAGYEADVSLMDVARWLKNNSPALRKYSAIYIQNAIATLNSDRVLADPSNGREFHVIGHRPLHIPRDWLPETLKLGKGVQYPRGVVQL